MCVYLYMCMCVCLMCICGSVCLCFVLLCACIMYEKLPELLSLNLLGSLSQAKLSRSRTVM